MSLRLSEYSVAPCYSYSYKLLFQVGRRALIEYNVLNMNLAGASQYFKCQMLMNLGTKDKYFKFLMTFYQIFLNYTYTIYE